jgi:hypothetical protein
MWNVTHLAGYELSEGLDSGLVLVAPLCGQVGTISPRFVHPILISGGGTEPFPFLNLELMRLNEVEVAYPAVAVVAAWCPRCLMLADEKEGEEEVPLACRVNRREWAGRGGLALSSFGAVVGAIDDRSGARFFAGRNLLHRMKRWDQLVWLFAAHRAPEIARRLKSARAEPW